MKRALGWAVALLCWAAATVGIAYPVYGWSGVALYSGAQYFALGVWFGIKLPNWRARTFQSRHLPYGSPEHPNANTRLTAAAVFALVATLWPLYLRLHSLGQREHNATRRAPRPGAGPDEVRESEGDEDGGPVPPAR